MPDEPSITMTHPDIPGDETITVPLTAFTLVWEPKGWIEAEPGMQPTEAYLIPSFEKGAPYGVATLDAFGNVVQSGSGPSGGLDEAAVQALIDASVGALTAEDVGAIPDSTPAVLYVDNTIELVAVADHPASIDETAQLYVLTTDGTAWCQIGVEGQPHRTQLAPGFVCPSVELAAEQLIDTLTLETVLASPIEPNAVYLMTIPIVYESTVAASGERLRVAFDPPPGATGFYSVLSMNSTGAASGTLAPNWVAKQWDETFDIGGSGAGQPRSAVIRGIIYTDDHEFGSWDTPDSESLFEFKARLTTLDGAGVPLVPAKIYGANTVDYDASRMLLERVK